MLFYAQTLLCCCWWMKNYTRISGVFHDAHNESQLYITICLQNILWHERYFDRSALSNKALLLWYFLCLIFSRNHDFESFKRSLMQFWYGNQVKDINEYWRYSFEFKEDIDTNYRKLPFVSYGHSIACIRYMHIFHMLRSLRV